MSNPPAQPFSNFQPYLVVTEVTLTAGIFPSGGGGGSGMGDMLGFVYDFAGNFAPGTSFLTQGQSLSIAQNTAVFSLLGTTYGGNGVSTFALPNLQGTAIVGIGTGPGLTPVTLGEQTGTAGVTLTLPQIPPNTTPPGGGGQPFDNTQPSLVLEPLICTSGVFPSQGGNSGSAAFIGQIAYFEGNFVPSGWTQAAGQMLSITQNQALFAIIGTTYGGDGVSTFALPDLRGRVGVGADSTHPLGTLFGQQNTTLTAVELPVPAGSDQPVNNDQPSLALNYLIATSGIFPSQGGGAGFDSATPTLGQICAFAGNFAPSGWAFANGSLLSIAQNTALFSVIGTMYGGNGTTNFALPDLRGRTAIGSGTNAGTTYSVGDSGGSATITLTAAEIPPCFAGGTTIATARGKVAVEALRLGDRVCTATGELRPVIWIGWRRTNIARHPDPASVRPVRVAAHALGQDRPCRDIWLSPDHALFIDGVLIPVRYLINDATIVQEHRDAITYWHVELDRHDVILAEGLACESYLDTGNRGAFTNGGSAIQMHPEFALAVWRKSACAPLILRGGELEAARSHVFDRAGRLGHARTREPDLRLVVDSQEIRPEIVGRFARFHVPPGARSVRLVSRSVVPARLYDISTDHRQLGVAVGTILYGGELVPLTHPNLGSGWHPVEHGADRTSWRWTDGEATLSIEGGHDLDVEVVMLARYWLEDRGPEQKNRTAV